MIGLDSNVLVRYIMQDDSSQSSRAARTIESLTADEPGFVTVVSAIELTSVPEASYRLAREHVADALEGLLRTKELRVECASIVSQALRTFRAENSDFADCMIAAQPPPAVLE